MLNERQIETIEQQLNANGSVFYHSLNNESKERARGYCQGIGFVLSELGYAIEWHDEKATIVREA